MTGHRWKRAAALLLAGGMLVSQGGYVYAAEPESAEEMTMLYALDASGASVQISEADDTDHGEASEQPGSGTEPDKETDGAEDGSQPQEEQIPEEVEPEAEPEEAQLEEVHSDPAGVQKDEEQTEAEESQAEEETDTSDRESLIREAQIVQAPVVVDDFRFWTVARKYGFAKEDLHIREAIPEDTSAPETTSPEEGVRAIGYLKQDGLVYILKEEENGWLYVESGDVRGFVSSRYLETGGDVTARVENAGEESFPLASETVEPEEDEALYYTLTSVKSGVPGGEVRQSLLMFASQFIGNPYVWGGTSLTDGADCSGFVQSIYREYGYELPRVAAEQAYAGTQIPVEDALPGDLVFYADGSGNIYHVVIYAGDSKTIEAQSSKTGIVQGPLDTADAVWAVRLLEDSVLAYTAGDISEVNASSDMYGENLGVFDLTYYCACEICCDVETGITATGTPVVEGRTIAVDPSVIPYGTQVIINGHVFTAEDCGGSVRGNHIDIYVNDHQTALELGRGQAEVYLVK